MEEGEEDGCWTFSVLVCEDVCLDCGGCVWCLGWLVLCIANSLEDGTTSTELFLLLCPDEGDSLLADLAPGW